MPLRIASYARFSTDMQREESILAQQRSIREFCKRHGHVIVCEYVDEAKTGRTTKRPGLQSMLRDADAGLYDAVCVYAITRLSRDVGDHKQFERFFSQRGIEILSATEINGATPSARFSRTIMQAVSQLEVEQTGERIHASLMENAHNIQFNGGVAPYGYRIVNKKYEIDPTEAPGVRLAFQLYADGRSYPEISAALAREGYKPRSGKDRFYDTALHAMFRNIRYKGTYEYNRAPTRLYGVRNWHASKKENDIVRIEDALPRIIDDITWARAQNRMRSRERGTGKNKSKYTYILSGLCACDVCGQPISAQTTRNNQGRVYHYYRCYECRRTYPRDEVETFILHSIENLLLDPKAKALLLERSSSAAQAAITDGAPHQEVAAALKDTEKKIKKFLDIIEDGMATASIIERLHELEGEKKKLATRITQLTQQNQLQILEAKQMRSNILQHAQDIKNQSTDKISTWIAQYVERVFFSPQGMRIKWKHTGAFGYRWCRRRDLNPHALAGTGF